MTINFQEQELYDFVDTKLFLVLLLMSEINNFKSNSHSFLSVLSSFFLKLKYLKLDRNCFLLKLDSPPNI